jgi:hypothetical protein
MKKIIIVFLFVATGFSLRAQTPVDIYYHVPFIPQPDSVACWSSSIAMILWWRDNRDAQMSLVDALTPEQVALNIGYWKEHFRTGLDAFDTAPLEWYGFETVPPSSFPVETLADYLEHSPMWVAYNGCANPLDTCGHAVVLVGMHGDGTPEHTDVILHDPDDGSGIYPNLGVRDRVMPYVEFIERLNSRAIDMQGYERPEDGAMHFLAFLRHPPGWQPDRVEQAELGIR